MKRPLTIPPYVRQGIRHLRSGFPGRYKTFGFDTETVNGEPYTLQLCDGERAELWYANRRTILRRFLTYLDEHANQGRPNVVWGHNLEFDLAVLFRAHLERFVYDRWTADTWGWKWDVFCGARHFAFVTKGKTRVMVLDTFAFFPTSLAKVAKTLGLSVGKMNPPAGLGERRLTGHGFEEYAKRDAVLAREVGERILAFQRDLDVPISVTGPQMSGRAFRRHYLHAGECIGFPPDAVEIASRLSYHGGKNGLYCVPGWYDCTELDISSAYPYAMTLVPGLLEGSYTFTHQYEGAEVPGVYLVRCHVRDCRWPCFLDEDGIKVKPGPWHGWVTSWELSSAIANAEVDVDSVQGWVRRDWSRRRPLREYVQHYYGLKNRTPKADPYYSFYKVTMLNSLYGKFIQAIDEAPRLRVGEADPLPPRGPVVTDFLSTPSGWMEVEGRRARAGGLYHPFLATLITGHCRAYLHDLEHLYQALHSATDSIKTRLPVQELPGLGGLKVELSGPCLLLRNKLYLHHDAQMVLQKYALHGYQGTPEELYLSWRSDRWDYDRRKILRPREAVIQSRVGDALRMVVERATVRGVKGKVQGGPTPHNKTTPSRATKGKEK